MECAHARGLWQWYNDEWCGRRTVSFGVNGDKNSLCDHAAHLKATSSQFNRFLLLKMRLMLTLGISSPVLTCINTPFMPSSPAVVIWHIAVLISGQPLTNLTLEPTSTASCTRMSFRFNPRTKIALSQYANLPSKLILSPSTTSRSVRARWTSATPATIIRSTIPR